MSTRRRTLLLGAIALLAAAVIYVGMQPRITPLAPWASEGSGQARAIAARLPDEAGNAQRRTRAVATPRLRANPAYKGELENLVLARQFEYLMDRAHREPAFAYALAVALAQCATADRSYETLERHASDPSFQFKDALEPMLAAYERTFAKCRGLTAAQTRHRLELLTRAANAGVLEAQINYVQQVSDLVNDGTAVRTPNLADEIRTNGEAFTLAAARTGDPEALHAAYRFYRYGYLVPADNARAYSFYSAYARVKPSPDVTRTLAGLRSRLTADELRRAQ